MLVTELGEVDGAWRTTQELIKCLGREWLIISDNIGHVDSALSFMVESTS